MYNHSWTARGFQRGAVSMGWRNRFYLLRDGTASHIAKGKQRGMREFCGHFAMYYPGPHEQNSMRRESVALLLWGSFPDCISSAPPPLTVNELTYPYLRPVHLHHLWPMRGCVVQQIIPFQTPAALLHLRPSKTTEPSLSLIMYQPLNYSLCFRTCPSSPLPFILNNIAVRSCNFV